MTLDFLGIGIVIATYMSFWFIISLIFKRNDVADIAWGLGFAVVAWYAYIIGEPALWHVLLINILVSIWGIRLTIHVYLRNRGKAEDKRYIEMRVKWGEWAYARSYVHVFLTQGLLLGLIAMPVILANISDLQTFYPWQYGGLAVWGIGFFFESVGDWQLARFIKSATHKGQLMTKGLWRYTRHPNYFGEVTQWWGIFLLSLGSVTALWGVVGPLVITILILKISGIPMLERNMKENPAFTAYARQTSVFLPRPPRS